MTDISITRATSEHAAQLAQSMRSADKDEARAATGLAPMDAITVSLSHSVVAYTAIFNGQVAFMWGAGPAAAGPTLLTRPRVGNVWMLSGQAAGQHPKALLRAGLVGMDLLHHLYPTLIAYVDARYGAALRWVRWLGFVVQPAELMGAAGLPFHPAIKRFSWAS